MSKKTELKAAAARLLYNSNRSTSDYDMLIDFIDSHFDNQPIAYDVEAVVRELEDAADNFEEIWVRDAIEIVKGGRNAL